METRSALLVLCEGNQQSPMDSPHKGLVARSFDDSLKYAWTNGWTNRELVGDFKRLWRSFDVTLMHISADKIQIKGLVMILATMLW